MSVWDEAQAVLDENPQANVWREAEEDTERKTEAAVRTFELLNNPESAIEDFVPDNQKDQFSQYFDLAENPQAEREKFVEADMVSLSTGMPVDVAATMHSELKADGTIDAIKAEWTGERPGFFKRGLKKFGRSFVDTLTTISTKTPFGKSMTELDVFAERIRAAEEAGLMSKGGGLKEFIHIPKAETDELFAGETILEHVKRREVERAGETPGLAITAVPEAEGFKEKSADVAGNISAFVAKLALTKRVLGGTPGFTQSLTAWETVNLAEGGTPGKGAAMFVALRGIDKIPVKGTKGFFVKTGTQSGLFGGLTAAAGGTQEEVLTAAAIPWALRAADLAARGGVKLGRKVLEKRAVSNLRTIGKENGVNFDGVPDETLKFLIGKSKQARFWNKQFDKGKISEETLNKRLDLIRQDVEPALRAIGRQQPKPEAKPGDIVKTTPKPGGPAAEAAKKPVTAVAPEPVPVTAVKPPPAGVQPSEGLEAKREAVGKVEGITGVIKQEAVPSGRTGEDLELKPKFAEKFTSVAMLQGNKVIKAQGNEVNHAQIAERLGFPKDLIPGFIDNNDNFVFQFEEDIAQPTPTEQALKITSPDESLIDERRGITAIPAKQRTPSQIERLTEIETELVDRNIEKFPVKDITDKVRKAEIQKVTKEITEHEAVKVISEGAEAVTDLSGVFNVDSSEMADVRGRFEGRPEILKKFNVQETGGTRWDSVAAEKGIEGGLDDFMDAVELFVETRDPTKGKGVNQAFLDEALKGDFPDLELLDTKNELLLEGETAAIINQELTDLADQLGIRVEEFLVPTEGVPEAQRRADILKEVTKTKPKPKIRNLEKEAVKKAQDRSFKEKTPIFITEKDGKFSVSKRRPTKGEFVRVTPPEPGQLEGKTERLIAGPTPEEVAEGKKLKQQINIVAKTKGFTKKKFNEIKMQHGGTKKLTRMDIEQLKSTLKGVKRARPKIVNHKTVVTPKTERQIGTLKENLTKSELMNEDEWEKILAEETGGKLPKYISEKAFITQSQGRKVLAHMHDTAEKLRATESFRKAVEADPDLALAQAKDTSPELTDPGDITKAPIEIRSMRKYIQKLEERLGEPIYHIFQDITFANQRLTRERRKLLDSLEEMPGFIDIAKSPAKIQRVSDYIASKSTLTDKPKVPEGVTEEEIKLADRIQGIFKFYELQARMGKFFQFKDDLSKMPQYLKFKKEIDRAGDIYDSEGLDALVDYLRTQPWGIVASGYEPMESVIRSVSTHRMPDVAVGKSHIKERGIQYNRQERNILQRLESYMRQMDNLSFMQPKIKALVREVNDNLDRFSLNESRNVSQTITTYLDNLKKANNEDGWTERNMRKIYAQAITTLVLADPIVKPVRNLAQNAAFSEDRGDFIKLAARFAKKGEVLSEQDTEYLETFVHQDRVMLSDWAFTGEDPIDFLFHKRAIKALTGWDVPSLTKWVQRHTLYPASDRVNRTMSYSAKLWRVKDAWAKDQSLAAKEREARFSDMQWGERQLAREILARDGVEAMARFMAKVHTDNTHFLYAREQRSPAEQTKVGKMVWNLALFKRAALEKSAEQLHKIVEEGATFQERRRAARVLVSLVASSIIVNLIYKAATGKKRGAYDFIDFLQFDAGGLELGAINKITSIYNSMLDASRGDAKALSALAISIPAAADTFIPYYDMGLRFIEAYMGTENIDRVPFRKMREMIDAEYESRGIQEVDRNLVEKLQFAFAKGKVEKETKKRKIGKR